MGRRAGNSAGSQDGTRSHGASKTIMGRESSDIIQSNMMIAQVMGKGGMKEQAVQSGSRAVEKRML